MRIQSTVPNAAQAAAIRRDQIEQVAQDHLSQCSVEDYSSQKQLVDSTLDLPGNSYLEMRLASEGRQQRTQADVEFAQEMQRVQLGAGTLLAWSSAGLGVGLLGALAGGPELGGRVVGALAGAAMGVVIGDICLREPAAEAVGCWAQHEQASQEQKLHQQHRTAQMLDQLAERAAQGSTG